MNEEIMDEVLEYYSDLIIHQENDKPDKSFTPIYNRYLKSGCKPEMSKEEAKKQKMFFVGDLDSMADAVEAQRNNIIKLLTPYLGKSKATQQAENMYPYEFLFVDLM